MAKFETSASLMGIGEFRRCLQCNREIDWSRHHTRSLCRKHALVKSFSVENFFLFVAVFFTLLSLFINLCVDCDTQISYVCVYVFVSFKHKTAYKMTKRPQKTTRKYTSFSYKLTWFSLCWMPDKSLFVRHFRNFQHVIFRLCRHATHTRHKF